MAFQAKPKTKYDMATQTHKVVKPKAKSKGKKPDGFGTPKGPPEGNSYAPKQPF